MSFYPSRMSRSNARPSMAQAEISSKLRRSTLVSDREFDAWLPEFARLPSSQYWTQVSVAMRACHWMQASGARTVLDVGSGVGKFCVVAALCSRLSLVGVEHRTHLVHASARLASQYDVGDRVRLVKGTVESVRLGQFDALYLYNPFAENIYTRDDRLDSTVELSLPRFNFDVTFVAQELWSVPVGTVMVTYNGCGAYIPDTFDLVRTSLARTNLLRLWRRSRAASEGGWWLERDRATVLHMSNGEFRVLDHVRKRRTEET